MIASGIFVLFLLLFRCVIRPVWISILPVNDFLPLLLLLYIFMKCCMHPPFGNYRFSVVSICSVLLVLVVHRSTYRLDMVTIIRSRLIYIYIYIYITAHFHSNPSKNNSISFGVLKVPSKLESTSDRNAERLHVLIVTSDSRRSFPANPCDKLRVGSILCG